MTEFKDKIRAALERLIKEDLYLLDVGINERSLTHRLAVYLEELFPDYHVDCEYNRINKKNVVNPKRTNWREEYKKNIGTIEADNNDGLTVFPDIIIHRRGTTDNFVVIEAKKSTTTNDKDDKEKLHSYKRELKYRHAFFVRFPVKDGELSLLNGDKIDTYINAIF